MAGQKRRVMQAFTAQRGRHAQQQRGIGLGPQRKPLRCEKLRCAVRADHRAADPGFTSAVQPSFHGVRAGAPRGDLPVVERPAAAGDDQAGIADDAIPVGHPAGHRLMRADYMRQEELRRTPAIVAGGIGAAAAGKQKAPHLGARMVKAPGGRAAVGAAKNPLRPAFASHKPRLAQRRTPDAPGRIHHGRNGTQHGRGRRVARATKSMSLP